MRISDIKRFCSADGTTFKQGQLKSAGEFLRGFPSSDLSSVEDCKEFIQWVAKYRSIVEEATALNGSNFLPTIRGLLGVGANGLYKNKLRFLFELVQNADDCQYIDAQNASLTIDFEESERKLVLHYNELGFTPENIFSISGIAEASKNISQATQHIGEKGIGFKAVFGVASHVLVRSGKFSFRFEKEHNTIPIPDYPAGFSPVRGTELHVFFDSEESYKEVLELVEQQYGTPESIFVQNPVLYLNKLRYIEFRKSGHLMMAFSWRPGREKRKGELYVLNGTELILKCHGKEKIIRGTLYKSPIKYNYEHCMSRYGENTSIISRDMWLHAFFPDVQHVLNSEGGRGELQHGVLYSFLPTRVEVSVPIICNAPFKLDASREYVDPQNNNSWFLHTISTFARFIGDCLLAQAESVGYAIVAYLPTYSKNLFADRLLDKVEPLIVNALDGPALSSLRIFRTTDGRMHTRNEIGCFEKFDEFESPEDIWRLCGSKKPLFRMPKGIFPNAYNIEWKKEPLRELLDNVFRPGFGVMSDIRIALRAIISARASQTTFAELFRSADCKIWNVNHIRAVVECGCFKELRDDCIKAIKQGSYSWLRIDAPSNGRRRVLGLIDGGGDLSYSDMGPIAARYFGSINGECLIVTSEGDGQCCIPAGNICVVVGRDPAAQLIELCRRLDPDSLFYALQKIGMASQDINRFMDEDDPAAFLRKLRGVRVVIRNAMGQRAYKSFLELIQNSGANFSRYIQELLQNADDCEYDDGVEPELNMLWEDGRLVVTTNERGFSARHVRAITAIGESTKRRVFRDDKGIKDESIGEKGVGFKSVFSIAHKVEIHSGAYHFALLSSAPTIPEIIVGKSDEPGTRMEFCLKDGIPTPAFTNKDLLKLCMCLHKLRKINFNGIGVRIEDSGASRTISVGDEVSRYDVVKGDFTITDSAAISSRCSGGKKFSAVQTIVCYVPEQNGEACQNIYSGLPTKDTINAPLIFDVPFALTTSRESVLQDSKWNEIVHSHLLEAVLQIAVRVRTRHRINVLMYFGIENGREISSGVQYSIRMFDGPGREFLNPRINMIDKIRRLEIVPVTKSREIFLPPSSPLLRVFPQFLCEDMTAEEIANSSYLQVDFTGAINKDKIRGVLAALGVKELSQFEFWKVIDELGDTAKRMQDANFRKGVYRYLQAREYDEGSDSRPIIPIKTKCGVKYVARDDGKFYFAECDKVSNDEYFVVDTNLMRLEQYEKIFDERLKELTSSEEQHLLQQRIIRYIFTHDEDENYRHLLGMVKGEDCIPFQKSWPTIESECRGRIPLKNRRGEVVCGRLFVCDRGQQEFKGRFPLMMIAHEECFLLARLMSCKDFSEVTYGDIPGDPLQFGRDEIADFQSEYFSHGADILRLAVWHGRIDSRLAYECGLTAGLVDRPTGGLCFPEEPVHDEERLLMHVQEQIENPTRIVCRKVERQELCGQNLNGALFPLDSSETRKEILRRYSPVGHGDMSFCQMCGKARDQHFMEVNAIELGAKYYWSQMRLCLCLECSKKYELMRNDKMFIESFISSLANVRVMNLHDNVRVSLSQHGVGEHSLTFTCAHLLEIIEILRRRRNLK